MVHLCNGCQSSHVRQRPLWFDIRLTWRKITPFVWWKHWSVCRRLVKQKTKGPLMASIFHILAAIQASIWNIPSRITHLYIWPFRIKNKEEQNFKMLIHLKCLQSQKNKFVLLECLDLVMNPGFCYKCITLDHSATSLDSPLRTCQ